MKLIALTAPSGAGKTTIAHRLLEAVPGLRFSVSATTRPPRAGEVDGEDYHFLSEADFLARVAAGDFLEYEEVYPGRYYGTLAAEVERLARTGPVLLDLDVKGALNVKGRYGALALALYIRPPSLAALAERLRARGTETEASLTARLERAHLELGYADRFDGVVVNDDLETAVAETLARVRAFLGA